MFGFGGKAANIGRLFCPLERGGGMEREAEINQIKQELVILQARHALYRRTAGILRVIFIALMPLLAIGALAFAIKFFLFDALYGVFFVAALLIFVAVMIWLIRTLGLRWIDLASPELRGIYSPTFFNPDMSLYRGARSEAELIERQIADRERRLSELGESAPC
jgi:hypothetical protein